MWMLTLKGFSRTQVKFLSPQSLRATNFNSHLLGASENQSWKPTSVASAEMGYIQASISEDAEAKDVMRPY